MIANIKNAFKNTPDSDFPRLLAGELKISGFGSCMNGLWNIKKSDIDVTCIVNDKQYFIVDCSMCEWLVTANISLLIFSG